jgi:molybdopterin converting factor small subunit
MRVLLKEGATEATAATILVLPVCSAGMFETLSGERVPQGIVADADPKVVVASASIGAEERGNPFVTSKDLLMDLTWLDKELADFEEGAKVCAQFSGGAYVLCASKRTPVESAEELAEGDAIAIFPVNGLINARGTVVSVDGKWMEVEIDPGDRKRFEGRTSLVLGKRVTVSFTSVEKMAPSEAGTERRPR